MKAAMRTNIVLFICLLLIQATVAQAIAQVGTEPGSSLWEQADEDPNTQDQNPQDLGSQDPNTQRIEAIKALLVQIPDDEAHFEEYANKAEEFAESLLNDYEYAGAVELYQIALERREKYAGSQDFSLVKPLLAIADCYYDQRLLDDAIVQYQRALIITEQTDPEADKKKLVALEKCLEALGGCYIYQDNPEAAIPYCRRAYQVVQRAYGAKSTNAFWSAVELNDALCLAGLESEVKQLSKSMFNLCREHDSEREPTIFPLRFWGEPKTSLKASILCIHGLGLHAGSYADLAKALSQRGYWIVAVDVRGFGSWRDSKAQDFLDLDRSLVDIESTLKNIREVAPRSPIFVLGESMGGAIALRAAALYPGLINGTIAACPAGKRYKQAKESLKVTFHQLTQGSDDDLDIGKSVIKRATKDLLLQERWSNDLLARTELSPKELMTFQGFMNKNLACVRSIDSTPVLVVQGMKDRLVKPAATEQLFQNLLTTKRTLLKLDNCEHLIFEENQFTPKIIDQVTTWMNDTANAGIVQ